MYNNNKPTYHAKIQSALYMVPAATRALMPLNQTIWRKLSSFTALFMWRVLALSLETSYFNGGCVKGLRSNTVQF